MPLIPVLWRQRQEDLFDFEARLVYIVTYWTARSSQKNKNYRLLECKRYFIKMYHSATAHSRLFAVEGTLKTQRCSVT